MENINYADERIINILNKAESKSAAQRECLEQIDLGSITNSNLGESKYFYHKCMNEKGFPQISAPTRETDIKKF